MAPKSYNQAVTYPVVEPKRNDLVHKSLSKLPFIRFKHPYFVLTILYILGIFTTLALNNQVIFISLFVGLAFVNWVMGSNAYEKNYILLIIVIAFYNSFSGDLFGFDFSKADSEVYMANLANILGLLLVVQLLVSGYIKVFPWNRVDSIILVYTLWVALTTFTAIDYDTAFSEFIRLPSFIFLYATTRMFYSRMNWSKMLNCFYAMTIAITAFALYKIYTGSYYGSLSTFIFFLAPLVFIQIRQKAKLISRELVILFISSASLLVSESRRIFLSVAAIWAISISRSSRSMVLAIPMIIIANFLVTEIESQGEGRYTQTFEQVETLGDEVTEDQLNELGTGRLNLWFGAIKMIGDYPIFGVGPGNVKLLMPAYAQVAQIRAHNVFLDTGAQLGLVGLVIFLVLIIQTFRLLIKLSRKKFYVNSIHIKNLAFGFAVALLAALITAFFGGHMLFDKWGWIYFGTLASLADLIYKPIRKGIVHPD